MDDKLREGVLDLLAKMETNTQSKTWCVVSYDPETQRYSVNGIWGPEEALVEAGKMRELYDQPGSDLGNMEVHVAEFYLYGADG